MIPTLPSIALGMKRCSAPFEGLVLLGIRNRPSVGKSVWFALDFVTANKPISEVTYYLSEDSSFPDSALVERRRPVLMAAATNVFWNKIRLPDQTAFINAVLSGEFEIGGNFPKYRQHLEWFLTHAPIIDVNAGFDHLDRRLAGH